MSTKIGKKAEDVATEYLKKLGYRIIDRNWKIPAAEIDIVARRKSCIFFVEVKYRKSITQGDGLDYITRDKLSQMQRSASFWILENHWDGEYQLSAISLNKDFKIVEFIKSLLI